MCDGSVEPEGLTAQTENIAPSLPMFFSADQPDGGTSEYNDPYL
jgi:hypothetical protein